MKKERLNIIRNAVRCFYINNNHVLCLKTKDTNLKPGYLDVPGGKIEENETMEQTVIREFKEETGLDIENPTYRWIISVVLPEKTFRFNTFVVDKYSGKMKETEEHIPLLMNIEDVLKCEKRFSCLVMLEPSFIKVLLDKTETFKLVIHANEEEKIKKLSFEVKRFK